MRIKLLVMSVLVLASLGVGYFIGFTRARSAAIRQEDIFDLHVFPQLYMVLQEGDTNELATKFQALIGGYYSYYEAHFSNEVVTDGFTNDLAVAREVYNEGVAEVQQMNRTNRAPNTALEPTATAPSVSDKP